MGDYYAGQLTIGGKISDTQAEALLDALNNAGSLEYGEAPFEPKTQKEILDALSESGHLIIRNDQARDGEFADAEAALTEAGIAWERWSTGFCEYEAAIGWWHPGMESPGWSQCDENSNQLCSMEPVAEALKIIEDGINDPAYMDIKGVIISDVLEKLQPVVKKIPELPKFKFV